jgi:biopolymer transport protein ExbD
MIDTIFFLLVFFMIFSLSLSRQAGIGIEAPEGGAPLPRAPEVVVAIPFEGSLLVDGVQVAEGDLRARLEQALTAHPDAVAVIAADRNVKHGRGPVVSNLRQAAGAARQRGRTP